MDEKYLSCDGYPVQVGAKFWNNDLKVVQIMEVGVSSNKYADTGETQTWHQTTHGQFDTLSGNLQQFGRLVRHYRLKDAEDVPYGTSFREIR